MKIGIFDPYLDTLSGGEKYMLSIASCLAHEHEVFIFWDKNKELEVKQAANRKLGINLASVEFHKNIFNKSFPFLSRLLESKKFDAIIYLSDGSIPFIATKLFIHFQFPVEWVNGGSIKNAFKLHFVKKVFCNSYFTKQFIDEKLGVKSEVLYPPVELHVDKNIKKESVILHVGRLHVNENGINYKKQDIMINAFKKMVDDGLRGWEFDLVVGVRNSDKEDFDKLKGMIRGYPIKLLQNISNQELWETYSKSKIYWHATGYEEDLQESPEKAEHFGISTVEAMGSGCVPVVFNAGGQKEIIENGKDGFLCDNMKDFISNTKILIGDEKLLEKMSRVSIKKSNMFAGDRFCKELRELIK